MEKNEVFNNLENNKFIPIYKVNRAGNLSDSFIDDKFSLLRTAEKADLAAMIVGYALGGICIIACGILLWKFNKQKEELASERVELMDGNNE